MELQRIQREIREAGQYFPNIDAVPTGDGGVYVKGMLQTSLGGVYFVDIRFDGYPYQMPKVTVVKPALPLWKHRYTAGHICYMHPSMWNPGKHDVKFVLLRAAKWLNKYEVFVATGTWPGAEIQHA